MPDYRVRLVSPDGTLVAELPDVRCDEVTKELNRPDGAKLRAKVGAGNLAALVLVDTEVQVWRNATLLTWCVPWVREIRDGDEIEITCDGLPSYFARRRVGAGTADVNLATNPSFETNDPPDDWSIEISPSHGSATLVVTRDTGHIIDGTYAAKFVQSEGDLNEYLYQEFVGLADTTYVVTVFAWVDSYDLPAVELRGLMLADTTNHVQAFTTIDRSPDNKKPHPLGRWVRHAVQITTGPSTPTLRIRLYGPKGTMWWDKLALVEAKSLKYVQIEQHDIAWALLAHALAQGGTDLNITSAAYADSGILRDREYPYAENAEIAAAVNEYTELDAGFDHDVVVNGTTGVREWTPYFPRKGTARPKLALEYGRNITSFTYREDATAKANEVIVYGKGDGASRPRAVAADVSGVLLQRVFVEQQLEYGSDLQGRADRLLRGVKDAPQLLTVTVKDTPVPVIGVIDTGDVLPIRIKKGWLQIAADYRVMKWTLKTADETLELELELDIDGAPRVGRLDIRDELEEFVSGKFFEPNNAQWPDFTAGFAGLERDLIPFARPGPITAATGDAKLEFPFRVELVGVVATLGVAGTGTDTVVNINRNGATIFGDIPPTIPAGEIASPSIVPIIANVGPGDFLTCDVLAAGAGAKDLTVIVQYRITVT